MSYNPHDWYWLGADGRIFSSVGQTVVAATDAGYEAFLAAGHAPAGWPRDISGAQTDAALDVVLAPYGMATSPATALISYANAKQLALRDGGITVNAGTASAPIVVDVASDADGRTLVSGSVQLVGLATSNSQPAPTFPWINNDHTQVTLTGAQMMTVGYALGAYVQATYAALGTVLAAIAAGTIKTSADVEAAAWPSTAR